MPRAAPARASWWIVGAVVVLMGVIAMRPMLNAGYDVRLASGAITAGGTLGILIPPSVNMIIYGSMTNTSVGKLFVAGILPGLLLSASFMLYIFVKATVRRDPIRHGVVPLADKLGVIVFDGDCVSL